MFAGILAQHQPQLLGAAGTGAPAPSVPPSPQPPADNPIAFSVVTRASVFGIIGSALGTVTLATVTCADASMTLALSESIPGLTFSYSANALTVSGTPTGTTKTVRVVASYIASDGSNQIRGSSIHTFTLVNASEVLTIGAMANPSIRAGRVESVTLASPSANYDIDVYARAEAFIPSLRNRTTNAPQAVPVSPTGSYLGSFSADLGWTKASPTSSGTLTFNGCFPPTGYDPSSNWQTGAYTFEVGYYARGSNVFLGRSTHTVTVTPAHGAAPAPSPATPAPPAPAPSPPPVPSPAPAPGTGPDPLYGSVRFLFRFDDETNLALDQKGGAYTATGVTYGTGAVRGGGVFTGAGSRIDGPCLLMDGGAITLDAWVNPSATAWSGLLAPGTDFRFCPVVTLLDAAGQVVWALGFESYADAWGNRQINALATHQLTRPSADVLTVGFLSNARTKLIGQFRPNRYVHLCMVQEQENSGTRTRIGLWLDGMIDSNSFAVVDTPALRTAGEVNGVKPRLLIGGACPGLQGFNFRIDNIVPFDGLIDEVRGTQATRHADRLGSSSFGLLPADRVIPWPNY